MTTRQRNVLPVVRLALFAALSASAYSALGQADTIPFVAAYDVTVQSPYQLGEGESIPVKRPGIAVEMMQLLGQRVPGLDVRLVRRPWKRCLAELKDGLIDGVFTVSFSEARLEIGAFPMRDDSADVALRFTTQGYNLYRRADSALSWDGQRIRNVKGAIGAPAGYSVVEDLERLGVSVEQSRDTWIDFRKLLHGRLEGAAALDLTGDFYLQKPEFRTIVKIDAPLATKHYYLMISHAFLARYPSLSQQIWQELAEIRESESERLLDEYVGKKRAAPLPPQP